MFVKPLIVIEGLSVGYHWIVPWRDYDGQKQRGKDISSKVRSMSKACLTLEFMMYSGKKNSHTCLEQQ